MPRIRGLARQIKDHSFTRIYEAVVYGRLKEDEGRIEAPIGWHPVKTENDGGCGGRPAVTHYTVIARYDGFTHIRLRLGNWADAPDPCAYGISWASGGRRSGLRP